MSSKPKFFATPAAWRAWLEAHHATETEVSVGFYKRDSGRPSITWPESVDGALCFGWIDGVRHRIDDISYCIRFTPRKPRSIWSAINIGRVNDLTAQGLMHAAGQAAFEKRAADRSAIYAYERKRSARLPPEFEKKFCSNQVAWKFFKAQPPWYQRNCTYWVVSAKRDETKLKRLTTLIQDSASQQWIAHLTRPESKR